MPGEPECTDAARTQQSTRERIALVAEGLFAEQGISAVSLRQIALAAGNGNNNAVQYHFGSKDALLQEIFRLRVAQMDRSRRGMIALAREEGSLGSLHTWVRILLLPHLELVDTRGRHPHAALMIDYLTRLRPAGVPHPADDDNDETSATLRTVLGEIYARLEGFPAEVVDTRIKMAQLMFSSLLVLQDHGGDALSESFALRVRDVVQLSTNLLTTPLPDELAGAA